jgi:imidazolonepropionase-like amidohydrolase
MLKLKLALNWLVVTLLSPAVLAQTGPVLVFEHANVIDAVAQAPARDVTVIVKDGKIASISHTPPSIPPGARRFDLTGRWLLPGLIDAHVHPEGIEGARSMLATGVTTARSMFTFHYADVGLRELHRRGDVDLPEVLAAGYPLVPNFARFQPDLSSLFLEVPELDDLRRDADIGPEGVRRIVRANLDHHVDVIKVFATDRAGVASSDPRRRMLSDEELAVAVAEARRAGVPVAAHAHGDEGAAAAVRAGVSTIEHGTYLSDATLSLMKQRNACFVPTLAAAALEVNPGAGANAEAVALAIRTRAMLPRARNVVKGALQLDVKVIAGADSGYTPDDPHRVTDELAELVIAGMSPMEAIQAATARSAECLGISTRTGAIREGLEADMVVLDRNPLDDINAVREVLFVINDGRVAIDHSTVGSVK